LDQVTASLHRIHSESALHYVVMPIPEILKQIDAEIAPLKQVRDILADKPPASKPAAKRTHFAAMRQSIGEVPRRPRAVEKVPVVTVLEPVVRRTRAAQPRAVAPATIALTATVPMGPIAVRAADVPVRVVLPPPPPRRGILDAVNFLS
jgi:hypothetical protein